MKKIEDRVAVVTGAASGIGRATSLALAAAGARVALVDLDGPGLEPVAAEIAAAGGRPTTSHVVDVACPEAVGALADEVADRCGAVHIVVNNAGLTVIAPFEETSLEDWQLVLGVNVWGVVNGCRSFLPHLRRAEEGHLVNISSLFGIVGVPGQSAYCASKFAVRGLSEVLWEELRGTSIGVTVVHPGGIRTNIIERAKCADPEVAERIRQFFRRKSAPPEVVARKIVRAIRRNRPRVRVTPETIALDWLRRLAPVLGNRLSAGALVRMLGLSDVVKRLRAGDIESS